MLAYLLNMLFLTLFAILKKKANTTNANNVTCKEKHVSHVSIFAKPLISNFFKHLKKQTITTNTNNVTKLILNLSKKNKIKKNAHTI